MTDIHPAMTFASDDGTAVPLHALFSDDLETWRSQQSTATQDALARSGFSGGANQGAQLPDGAGGWLAVAGLGSRAKAVRGRFLLGGSAGHLPEGTYRLLSDLGPTALAEQALGWLLAGYRFDRYKALSKPGARLVAPTGVDAARIEAIAAGEALTRDLINTPANDMGPAELEAAAQDLANTFGAKLEVTSGAVLERDFPLIYAVGRASSRAPRLIDLRAGDTGPTLTLVGKGVCFDTGGLNLKPGSAMGIMKKDMGGSATVFGLARMILSLRMPLRLRVLIPAVENAVSGDSFRPGDVLRARNGMTVEINNTDAEGRLVLADALSLAAEEDPDLLVSMATLTGAARVAVGPDIAPFFSNDDELASALTRAGPRVADPVWQLPFHDPYETMIEPAVADLDNAPAGGFAGAITAALFLRRFAEGARSYTHFDIYGWQPSSAPARPKGGVGQGARALLDALPEVLNL